MLGGRFAAVFSKRAVFRPAVGTHDAAWDTNVGGRRGKGGAIGGWRLPEGAAEAGRERADALQPDREADLGDRVVGGAQQAGGALEAPRQKVGVRRLAEGTPKLAAEMSAGEAGGASHVIDAKWFEVASVGKVPGAQEMPGRWDMSHAGESRLAAL